MKKTFLAAAVLSAALLCGCVSWNPAAWFGKAAAEAVTALPAATNTPAAPAAAAGIVESDWPAWPCPDGFGHGYEGENEYRDSAVKAARAAVPPLDCLAVTMKSVPNPELSIHLLNYESPVDHGKYLPSAWFFRARAAGVTRWKIDIRPVENQLEAVADRFQAYEAGSVCFVFSAGRLPEAKRLLGVDDNGIKRTPPRAR